MSIFKTTIFKLISSVILVVLFIFGCKVVDEIKKDLYVKITTSSDLSGVLWTSATLYGEVTDDGGKAITEKGIVYGKNPLPTVNDTKVPNNTLVSINGDVFNPTGVGRIGVLISNLTVNNRYYFRAYCINSYGVSYGEEQSFYTKQYEDPKVTTTSITATSSSINVSGNLTNLPIVGPIVGSGFYYSESSGVKETNNFVLSSSSIDAKYNFSATIPQLPDRTVYYVKAFVRTAKGVYLGNELMVKTLDSPMRTQLKTGLQVFYSFAGNSADESGNGFNGTTSGVILTADRFNNSNSAYYFNGQNNTNISTNYSGVLGNATRSFSFWLRRKDPIGNSVTIFSYGNLGTIGQAINIAVGKDPTGNLILFDNGGSAAGTVFNLVDDKWHHYVMIWDKSFGSNVTSIKQYIDGVYRSNTWSYNPSPINTVAGSKLLIGQLDPSKNDWRTFLGSIDDLGIWNRVLSSDEIQYLYQSNYRP